MGMYRGIRKTQTTDAVEGSVVCVSGHIGIVMNDE